MPRRSIHKAGIMMPCDCFCIPARQRDVHGHRQHDAAATSRRRNPQPKPAMRQSRLQRLLLSAGACCRPLAALRRLPFGEGAAQVRTPADCMLCGVAAAASVLTPAPVRGDS